VAQGYGLWFQGPEGISSYLTPPFDQKSLELPQSDSFRQERESSEDCWRHSLPLASSFLSTLPECSGGDRSAGVEPGRGLRRPLAVTKNGAHLSTTGITDVAIGDGLIQGEPKAGPPDVAYHLTIPPDGLQAKHGHFPERSHKDSWEENRKLECAWAPEAPVPSPGCQGTGCR
jgi:hypothetical protein